MLTYEQMLANCEQVEQQLARQMDETVAQRFRNEGEMRLLQALIAVRDQGDEPQPAEDLTPAADAGNVVEPSAELPTE